MSWWRMLVVLPLLGCDQLREKSDPGGELSATGTPVSERTEPATGSSGTGQAHELGLLARTAHFSMSVQEVKDCPLTGVHAAPKGRVITGVLVELSNLGGGALPANPYYAKLTAEGGRSYSTSLRGCQPALLGELVPPGGKARGWFSFQVPSGSHRLQLSYSPPLLNAKTQTLRFAVKR